MTDSTETWCRGRRVLPFYDGFPDEFSEKTIVRLPPETANCWFPGTDVIGRVIGTPQPRNPGLLCCRQSVIGSDTKCDLGSPSQRMCELAGPGAVLRFGRLQIMPQRVAAGQPANAGGKWPINTSANH